MSTDNWHHYCTICVDGTPKGQGRPRACKMGSHIHIYNPKNADSWRERIFYGTNQHKPKKPFDIPIRMDVKFRMPRPKRLMRKKDPLGEIPCTSKPDIDNLLKVVFDGMKDAGWYLDDSYVTAGYLDKVYHHREQFPGATIMVWCWR